MNDHCFNEELDAVLISLDAKKAFDSVSHEYIEVFCPIVSKQIFGPIPWQAAEIIGGLLATELQSSELQSYRVTES